MHLLLNRPSLLAFSIVVFGFAVARSALADDGNAAPPPPPPEHRAPAGPPGVQRALDQLQLTDDQKQRVDPLVQEFRKQQEKARNDFLAQMKTVLTPEQYEHFESAVKRPPPPPPPPLAEHDQANAPASQPIAAANVDPSKVPVTFTGGHDTDPVDHGRPVVLVAAGLNVPSEVFRKAFSGVKPAGAGQQPDPEQVRLNKRALLQVLEPYGVTNDRLDEVSNYYRYVRSRDGVWRSTPATAYATVSNGVVTAITITNPGAGYCSVPTITVQGAEDKKFTATLLLSTDLEKNGSIEKVTIDQTATAANP